MGKVVREFVLEVVEMLPEEGGCLLQDARYLLGSGIDQYHFRHIDNISLIGLFGQVSLVNLQSLQVYTAHQLAVGAAKLLDQGEDLEGIILVFELHQIAEKLVKNFGEKRPLAHSCLSKK